MALSLLDRSDLIISTENLEIIKEVIEVLRPFEVVTREISSDTYISVSKVIPLCRALQRLTTVYTGIAGTLSYKLSSKMARKFLNTEDNHLLAGSTLLDPRMKKLAFSDVSAAEKASRHITSESATESASTQVTTPVSTNKEVVEETLQVGNSGRGENLWQFLYQWVSESASRRHPTTEAITEMQQYFRIPNNVRKNDPLMWWKEDALVYPSIEKLVKKYLIIPGTSVPAERLFSKAGELVSARKKKQT